MTEFDLQKLHGIKLTIKWSTFWIILSIAGSTIVGSYKFGGVVNDMRADYSNVKTLVNKHEIQIPQIKQRQFTDSIIIGSLLKATR